MVNPQAPAGYVLRYKSRASGASLLDKYLSFFSSNPVRDGLVYGALLAVAVTYAVVALSALWFEARCDEEKPVEPWPNPEYDTDPCLDRRYWALLGLSPREADQYRRLLASLLLGSLIGYERRSPDRPAGIRTMSLVCLGACSFTISSKWAFQVSPMNWDAARVAAAIPSGVGFLGSAIIWKGFVKHGDEEMHEVHGLHTSASIWIAAAVGCICGGGMYVPALYTVLCLVYMLRFGPRYHAPEDEAEEPEEQEDPLGAAEGSPSPPNSVGGMRTATSGAAARAMLSGKSTVSKASLSARTTSSGRVTRSRVKKGTAGSAARSRSNAAHLPFKNPDYNPDPCLTTRFVELGGITLRECWFIRCIISSMILGSVIGYERRSPDRAAGIRSMSLTALGACCFTIAGNYACQTGPMNWDASRISAAIPSGVGFLGAGIIWKGYVKQEDGSPDIHQVHGLTTAASIWLSAAIGTACGGGLYPAACFTVTGIVLMLRFGPRNSEMVAEEEDGEPGGSSDSDEGAELAEAADMFRGGPETSSLSSSLLGRRSDEFSRATSSAVRRLGRTESKKSTFSHT
eukprot:jgi/Tetstr1/456234/TSEL_042997.t1